MSQCSHFFLEENNNQYLLFEPVKNIVIRINAFYSRQILVLQEFEHWSKIVFGEDTQTKGRKLNKGLKTKMQVLSLLIFSLFESISTAKFGYKVMEVKMLLLPVLDSSYV